MALFKITFPDGILSKSQINADKYLGLAKDLYWFDGQFYVTSSKWMIKNFSITQMCLIVGVFKYT